MTDPRDAYVTTSRRRLGIVTQTVLLASAVAAMAVLVAGVASAPFVRSVAETESRGVLSRLADLSATFVERREDRVTPRRILPAPLGRILREERIIAFLYIPGDDRPPTVSEEDAQLLLQGDIVSRRGVTEDGVPVLIEGRPVGDGAIVLIQPSSVSSEAADAFLTRIVIALVVGLLLAIVVAYWGARRQSRPLRDAREAANRMALGEREQVLRPSGAAEVADISEALNALNAALARSEVRQREFLLSVSHELRTPLTAIKGYGEALADGVLPDGDLVSAGETVASEAERLNRLVQDLLDLARLGADDFRFDVSYVDAARVLKDAAQVWRKRCSDEDVDFQISGADQPVMVIADPVRIRQIIDNLAENALRVSPAGSKVEFALHLELPEPGKTTIEVKDAGPGLTTEDMMIAFEPGRLFERYRGIRPVGTGLGLALVARLARGLRGKASVTRAAGGGSIFRVSIPSVNPDP